MEIIAKTRTLGGSLIVTIPKIIVEHENLSPGETIKIIVKKIRKDYFGSLPDLTFTEKDKLGYND